jgi:hypothetical protein
MPKAPYARSARDLTGTTEGWARSARNVPTEGALLQPEGRTFGRQP